MHTAREIASWWNTLPWGAIGAVVGTTYFLMIAGMGVKKMMPRGFFGRLGRFLKTSNGVMFLAMAAVYFENWVIHHKEQKDVARMLQFL